MNKICSQMDMFHYMHNVLLVVVSVESLDVSESFIIFIIKKNKKQTYEAVFV